MSSHVRLYYNNNIQGATLQNVNAELVRSLEGLQERRKNILIEIKNEEDKKKDLEQYIEKIQAQLEDLNALLERKAEIRNEFEKSITRTESAYSKVYYII